MLLADRLDGLELVAAGRFDGKQQDVPLALVEQARVSG